MTTHTVRLAGAFGKHDQLDYPGAQVEIDDKGNLLLIDGQELVAAWPHGEWASIVTTPKARETVGFTATLTAAPMGSETSRLLFGDDAPGAPRGYM